MGYLIFHTLWKLEILLEEQKRSGTDLKISSIILAIIRKTKTFKQNNKQTTHRKDRTHHAKTYYEQVKYEMGQKNIEFEGVEAANGEVEINETL